MGKKKVVGGRIVLDAAKAAAVRQVFTLAAQGYGARAIVKMLNDKGVPPIGRKAAWTKGYVGLLLRDRRVLGECQPRAGSPHKPFGPAITAYFPPLVNEQEWYAARAGAADGGHGPGRPARGEAVNVFGGVLRDARDTSTMILRSRRNKNGTEYHALVSAASEDGRAKCFAFPALPFERLVLGKLAELKPEDVFGEAAPASESRALADELAEVRGRQQELAEELATGGPVKALAALLRTLEAREKELAARLEEARTREARPLAGALGEAVDLAAALATSDDPNGARLRLRSALHRVLESAWVLVVPRKLVRLAALQLHFRDGARRDFLLYYLPPHRHFGGTSPAIETARSVRWEALDQEPGQALDLRDLTHVARLEKVLVAVDLSALVESGPRGAAES